VEAQRQLDEFEKRGARVIAVAQGTGREADAFCRQSETGFDCLGDPEKKGYHELGFSHVGWLAMIVKPLFQKPKQFFERIRLADMKGARMPHSDVQQLGGVAVIDRNGIVRLLHRAEATDDYPDAPEILAVLDGLD
jgi:peroxiredoxin